MFLEKYGPKTTREILGNSLQVAGLKRLLLDKCRTITLTGPHGCGKNLALELTAKEIGYKIVRPDIEGEDVKNILAASKDSGVFAEKKIILLELDDIRSKKIVPDIIRTSVHPVVMMAENPYDPKIANIVRGSNIIKFSKVDSASIVALLRKVCVNERIKFDDATMMAIARNANGDVRTALIDVEMFSHGIRTFEKRGSSQNIFSALNAVFGGTVAKDFLETDTNTLMLWLDENIQNEYSNVQDIARAYKCLSKADRFRALIEKRQSWSLGKYSADMFIYGMPRKKISFARYAPPKRVKQLDRELLEKVGHALHVSRKDTAGYLEIIRNFLDDREFCNSMGIEEEDKEAIRAG